MRRRLVVPTLMLVPMLILFSKGTREVEMPPAHPPLDPGKTFVIALPSGEDQLYLDPVGATDATSLLILDGLFEGLFAFDPENAKPVPAIAKEYAVTPDGLTWRFLLDERSRFSNGDVINASTFLDSWFWLLDEAAQREANTSLVSMMDCIEGVREYREGRASRSSVGIRAKGMFELEISLRTAAPYLPALLATTPFSAIHGSVRQAGKKIEGAAIISSGPFVVAEMESEGVLLAKHAWYRRYQDVPSDYIRFLFGSQRSIIEGYRNRSIHWSLAYIPRELLHSPQDLHISPEYSTGFYYFSARSGPYANMRVRQALAMLIPWDELRRESGQVFPTSRLIPDHGTWESALAPSDREEQALNILSEEGFPYGAGLPPLGMAVHRGSQVVESARMIADIWSSMLGITVILDVVPLGMYSRFPSSTPYDFAFITWIGDIHDPFAFLHLWTSESGYNLGNHQDPQFDKLVMRAMESSNERERELLAKVAEQHLLDSATVFPLYHGITTNIILSQSVRGWFDNILNIHPVKDLGITAR